RNGPWRTNWPTDWPTKRSIESSYACAAAFVLRGNSETRFSKRPAPRPVRLAVALLAGLDECDLGRSSGVRGAEILPALRGHPDDRDILILPAPSAGGRGELPVHRPAEPNRGVARSVRPEASRDE